MLDKVDQSTYKYLNSQPSNAPELNGRKFVIMDKHDYINYVKKSQRMTKDFVWLVHLDYDPSWLYSDYSL